MDRILRAVTRRAGWVVAIALALTVLAVSRIVDLRTGTPRLFLDPSVNSMLPAGDAGQEFYDRVRLVFGSDESILVVLAADDLFSAANLERIQQMTDRIGAVDGVHHVVSLANAPVIRSDGGDLLIEPLIGEIPGDADGLERIRESALSDPIYAGNLVSRDGRATAIQVYLRNMSEREFLERGIDAEISAIAREVADGEVSLWISGVAHIKAELGRALLEDLALVLPMAVAVMAVVAFFCFRTAQGVGVPLATIGISVVWTLALVAETAGALNQVTVAAPPILLVVGFAYAVHVVSEYYEELRSGEAATGDAVFRALRHVWLAVVLTGVTTAAGLISLATSPLGAIRQFAVISAVGVLIAMLVSLTVAPALLVLWPTPRKLRAAPAEGPIDRLLERVGHFDVRRRVPILAAGGVIAALSIWGMTRIQVSTDFVGNFDPESEVRRHFDAVNRHLEGSNALYVILEAEERDAFKEPEVLREIDRLQEWLESQPEIGGTTSLVDYVRALNRGFHGNDPEWLAIPETRQLVSQLLFFGGSDELERFVDSRYRMANVLVRFDVVDSGDVAALAGRIERRLAGIPAGLKATVTGNSVLVSRTIDDIARGQALSLATAFLIIYAILALLFTSLRVGLLALIPNALPVLVYFGVLGFTGVTLNTTTGLVACLVLGIAVDDTIHFLARFNASAKRLADETKGVVDAVRAVGRPVTFTSAALSLGFLALALSQLKNQVEFGLLASFTLAVAWLFDLTFTPALAARLRVVTLWDVLTLDLGEDPHLSIPFFAGLRKTQARITALMTSIWTFPKGTRLFKVGDEGGEMYVVIDGTLSASVPTDYGRVQFGTMKRGDVVGEVALFHGRRTADVEALSDVRLLRVTNDVLEHLRRRYPRTGAQVYRNLSKILADRVASTTEKVR